MRLAASFETALNLTDGIAKVASMDNPKAQEMIFSSRFACPTCGHSIAELEPRLFSFNSPSGACQSCDGLGIRQFFDAGKVVQQPANSLSEGAIRGWDRRSIYYYGLLSAMAKHFGFSMDTAWEKLPTDVHKLVLYGTGKISVEFNYINDRGDKVSRNHPFEGVINNMQRRYRETESYMVREY